MFRKTTVIAKSGCHAGSAAKDKQRLHEMTVRPPPTALARAAELGLPVVKCRRLGPVLAAEIGGLPARLSFPQDAMICSSVNRDLSSSVPSLRLRTLTQTGRVLQGQVKISILRDGPIRGGRIRMNGLYLISRTPAGATSIRCAGFRFHAPLLKWLR